MKKLFIPITDHNTGDICTLNYTVKFKRETDVNYTTLSGGQLAVVDGSPAGYGVWINGLDEGILYEYEIIRNCCNGLTSVAASGSQTTT